MSSCGGLSRVDVSAVSDGRDPLSYPMTTLNKSALFTEEMKGYLHVNVSLFFTHFMMLGSDECEEGRLFEK